MTVYSQTTRMHQYFLDEIDSVNSWLYGGEYIH